MRYQPDLPRGVGTVTRDRARRYFAEQLAKYRHVDCYWHGGRLVTRSIHVRLAFPVPVNAHFIGRYAYPFDSFQFLSDLDDAIALIRTARDSAVA